MGELFCNSCGKSNPGHAAFCWACGKGLKRTTSNSPDRPIKPATSSEYGSYFPRGRIEIKPKSTRNGILIGTGCLMFVAIGVFMLFSGNAKDVGVGLLCILFFGTGLCMVPKIMAIRTSFILDEAKLTQNSIYGSATIPWYDIEKVGLVSVSGQVLVGVRLYTYDRYLEGVSPEMAAAFAKFLPVIRVAAQATTLLNLPQQQLSKLWCAFTGKADPYEGLKSLGKVGSYVQMLLLNRELYGYDLTFGWHERDRSARDLANLLESYRSQTLG